MKRTLLFCMILLAVSSVYGQDRTAKSKIVTDEFCPKYNLSEFFQTWDETGTDGVFDTSYSRIQMHYDTVYKDKKNPYIYHIIGASRHLGQVTPFAGIVTITEVKKYDRQFFWVLDTAYPLPPAMPYYDVKRQCYIEFTADYNLREDSTQPYSGFFKGQLLFSLHQDRQGILHNDLPDWQRENYLNFTYEGTWTDYKSHKSVLCDWADGRLPVTPRVDVGKKAFRISDKYARNGWERNADDELIDDPKFWWKKIFRQ